MVKCVYFIKCVNVFRGADVVMEHDRVNLVGTNHTIREAVLFEPKVRSS